MTKNVRLRLERNIDMKAEEIGQPPGQRQKHEVIDQHETFEELAMSF
jgi:hypothetical protein